MRRFLLPKRSSHIHMGCIILLGILAYSNTLNVPFHFDDIQNIVENPFVRQYTLVPEHARSRFSSQTASINRNRVTGYLTFAVNYKLHDLDVAGYHIVNISVHILNGMLVYSLVLLTFQTPFFSTRRDLDQAVADHKELIALFSALLFVAHPIQTQAVTYIVQRFASLATLFFLISLVAYAKVRLANERTRKSSERPENSSSLKLISWYAVALGSAVLAMTTKEISLTLPIIIALYEMLFFQGAVLRRLWYLVPFLFTMLIIPFNLVGTGKPLGELLQDLSEASRVQTTLPRLDYFLTQIRVIITYIRLLFLPVNQNLDYDYPIMHSLLDPQVLLSAVFLFVILCAAVYLYLSSKTRNYCLRMTAFGIFWFFITLSVESSFFPIRDVIFEHRVYLPSVGFFLALTTSAFFMVRTIKHRWIWAEKAIAAALIFVIVVLTGASYVRNRVWADAISLWSDVVRKSPKKARGYNNLGLAYKQNGLTREALGYYQAALNLQPSYAVAHNNIADAYVSLGLIDKAIDHGQIAMRFKPDYAEAYNTTGLAYFYKGSYKKAIEHFRSAITVNPLYAEAYSNLGVAYATDGFFAKAIDNFQAALRLNPGLAGVHKNIALLYEKHGQLEKAKEHFRMADRLKK